MRMREKERGAEMDRIWQLVYKVILGIMQSAVECLAQLYTNTATARDVITNRNQCKILCKIHFRMANKTHIQTRAILEPQLQLL